MNNRTIHTYILCVFAGVCFVLTSHQSALVVVFVHPRAHMILYTPSLPNPHCLHPFAANSIACVTFAVCLSMSSFTLSYAATIFNSSSF